MRATTVVPRFVPAEIALLQRIHQETRSQFEMDLERGRHNRRHFFRADEYARGGTIAAQRGAEQLDVETRLQVILATRVAPRAQRVAEFQRQRHARQGIEIDQAQRMLAARIEQQVGDLGIAMYQARRAHWRGGVRGAQRIEFGGRARDCIPQAMLARGLAARAQARAMTRELMDRRTCGAQPAIEIGERGVEAREQRARRLGLRGAFEKIESTTLDPAQHAPQRAVAPHTERAGLCPYQARRQQAARGEMRGDEIEIVIHTRPKHRMQALQRERGAVTCDAFEGKIDQPLRDALEGHDLERIMCEHGGGRSAPGFVSCECHLVMIPLVPCADLGQRDAAGSVPR